MILPSSLGQTVNWNYQNNGPDEWPYVYPNCDGEKQSPINIEKKEVRYSQNLKPIIFKDYDAFYEWNVTHNGHSSKQV
jgi:carbonic anhydrase